jgi:glyoxylase-like metal-dependent hydrolase (beta-lactamase superfamily II)
VVNAGTPGPTRLEDGIRAAGHTPDDIAFVINTHLHFDHAGGNTLRDAAGEIRPAFPHARYLVQRGEYEFATHTNERTAGSYFPHNYVPIHESGLLDLVEGEREVLPGIRVMPTPGHVPFHQSIRLTSRGETALYLGDLVPTAAHLPLPWIMGYDLEPLVTLETKRRVLRQVAEEGWLAVFEHDAVTPWGRVHHDGKAYALIEDARS